MGLFIWRGIGKAKTNQALHNVAFFQINLKYFNPSGVSLSSASVLQWRHIFNISLRKITFLSLQLYSARSMEHCYMLFKHLRFIISLHTRKNHYERSNESRLLAKQGSPLKDTGHQKQSICTKCNFYISYNLGLCCPQRSKEYF